MIGVSLMEYDYSIRKPQCRRALACALVFIVMGITLSGLSAVMTYSTSMFRSAGLTGTLAKYATAAVGLCNFLVSWIAIFTIEKFGRRPLTFIGIGGMLISLVLMAAFAAVSEYLKAGWAAYVTIGCLLYFFRFSAYWISTIMVKYDQYNYELTIFRSL